MTHERDVERYLIDQVRRRGGEIRKVAWVGRSGAPDRLVLLSWPTPLTFWVELKAPDADMNTPTVRAQLREHERMRLAGCLVYVIDSKEGVDHVLNG